MLYLFAQGFANVSTVGFPSSIPTNVLKFDESEQIVNACGSFGSATLRKRRQDYYELLRVLLDAMESWTEFPCVSGPLGLENNVVNFRSNYLKAHMDGVRITVLDRWSVYKLLGRFESDIGETLRVILGMFILAEMHTREFMDTNVGSDWTFLRGDYVTLQLRAEKASLVLAELDPSNYDDRMFHLQAFVELVTMADSVLSNQRHLN